MSDVPHRIYSPFIRNRIGRRGAALMSLGITESVIGWSLFSVKPESYHALTVFRHIPHFAMSLSWIAAGATAVVFAFFRSPDKDGPGFTLAYVMPFLWGAFFVISAFPLGDISVTAGVRSAFLYWGYALLVLVISGWTEPIPEPHSKGRT